ncbi:hypothetical protein [Mycoplasmopsis bovis]|nr:hypothetical protein [Mycoplasmopsis bovis]WHL47640.1 hypothetical protein HYE50_04790 [Mycoplasmopsis bovis]
MAKRKTLALILVTEKKVSKLVKMVTKLCLNGNYILTMMVKLL